MRVIAVPIVLFVAVSLTACRHGQDRSLLTIEVRPETFAANGHEYRTAAELTAALEKLPPPESVYLKPVPGVADVRVDMAVTALHAANIKAPIGMVGNEVFH